MISSHFISSGAAEAALELVKMHKVEFTEAVDGLSAGVRDSETLFPLS